ncbi:MAG: signal recognition particle-docking protein FtsY, partial [Methanomicrobiales archaeon]|nr:signal recognition particle-docking protein FtsY [Methanomicrobiales archaeon]
MFNALRQKLQTFQKKVGESIKGAAPPEPVPAEPEQGEEQLFRPEEKKSTPTFGQKVKALVIERELIIAEKDIADSLQELEWALLENDVAV